MKTFKQHLNSNYEDFGAEAKKSAKNLKNNISNFLNQIK